eukprot:TRINITY_DN298_c0_g1_i1.p1 TRINITY_DN298_c0_g1~~TRINITY_DN298_c0_g1_i1.p1  ORF type:complete len:365 (-),score=57.18 TRINITY_DN298_c0_g1_i1:136-1230(-)
MKFVIFLVLCSWCLAASLTPKPKVQKEMLMKSFPYNYVHACSIQQLMDGTVVAVFHGGSGEDKIDSTVYTTRRDAKTGQWSEVKVAAKTPNVCDANPSLYRNPKDELYVAFHVDGSLTDPGSCSTKRWHGRYSWSKDGGLTWGDVQNPSGKDLPSGYLGGIKNKCIDVSNGDVLCPSSTEGILEIVPYYRSHIEITNRNFSVWSKSNDILFPECIFGGVIQPTLFETQPGHILALMRSSCKIIAKSYSTNYGRTFSTPIVPSGLPNPGAGIDGVKMENQADLGLMLMFNNGTSGRNSLTLAHSVDSGETWEHIIDLEPYNAQGSYAYPAVIQDRLNPRKVLTCYTHELNGTRLMAFASIDFSQN